MDDDQDEDLGNEKLKGLLKYLTKQQLPRRKASESLRSGFSHSNPKPGASLAGSKIEAVTHLAAALGYANHTSLYPNNGKLAPHAEDGLQRLYQILPDSSCWRAFDERNVELFKRLYTELHRTVDAASRRSDTSTICASPQPALVPLQWDARAEIKSVTTRYASLTLRTGNSPESPLPGHIQLGFDLDCPEDRTDAITTGLKRCLLIYNLAGGHTGPLAMRTGKAEGVEFDGALMRTLGTSITEPTWEITATGSGVIGKIESVPATFISIEMLPAGSVVRARIRASVKEILTTFVVSEGTQAIQSAAKRKIKARLVQLGLEGGDDGEADLASSEIALMAKLPTTT